MNEITTQGNAPLSIFDSSRFELAVRQADLLAKSDLVPKAFQSKPENCLIALELADRMNASAFMVMQNVDIIHGKPGFRALFLIGCFNACGRFDPISYEKDDEDGGRCRAISTVRSSGKVVTGPWVSMNMAKAEGWVEKNGSKWKTMPELMLCYRAAAFMIRTTAPEISLGLPTAEEIHDTGGEMGQEMRDTTPKSKFARELAEKTVETVASVEVIEPEPAPETPLDIIKGKLEESGMTVAEALASLQTLGIGNGRTSFSKMDAATLEHIAADWSNVVRVFEELKSAGGEA
jgi:hypothetical protein